MTLIVETIDTETDSVQVRKFCSYELYRKEAEKKNRNSKNIHRRKKIFKRCTTENVRNFTEKSLNRLDSVTASS